MLSPGSPVKLALLLTALGILECCRARRALDYELHGRSIPSISAVSTNILASSANLLFEISLLLSLAKSNTVDTPPKRAAEAARFVTPPKSERRWRGRRNVPRFKVIERTLSRLRGLRRIRPMSLCSRASEPPVASNVPDLQGAARVRLGSLCHRQPGRRRRR